MQNGRGMLRRGQDARWQVRNLGSGRQLGGGEPDERGHRPGVGEHRDPPERLGRGDPVVGSHRQGDVGASLDPAGTFASPVTMFR